jgi:hypothetical protein
MLVEHWASLEDGSKKKKYALIKEKEDMKNSIFHWINNFNLKPEDFGSKLIQKDEEEDAIKKILESNEKLSFQNEVLISAFIDLDQLLSGFLYIGNKSDLLQTVFITRQTIKDLLRKITK